MGRQSGNKRRGMRPLADDAISELLKGIAAHRDTLFRPLRNIKPGDTVVYYSPAGSYTYRVVWTKIVRPSDVSVLDNTVIPSLTLVSCYPFYYVGPAPYRFIVRAEASGPSQPLQSRTHVQ